MATVGNVNESTIVEYIKNQEENDMLEDGGKQLAAVGGYQYQWCCETPPQAEIV